MGPEGLPFGRYRLLGRLARGGMGEVWLAEARGAGDFRKQVVIKRVAPELSQRPQFVSRFLAEGRLAVALSHPNIVQVFDLDEEAGEPFLAMEHVDGWDLGEVLTALDAQRDLMPAALAVRLLVALAEALGYAHRRGVVYRDVSPGNVMLDRHGAIKLVDFGVAALTGEALAGLKVAWASPEQLAGSPTDARSDVYSLGVLAWTLLAGIHPYRGADDAESASRLGAPADWRGTPRAGAEPILRQMTEHEVGRRLADGDAAARALRALSAGLGPQPGPEELGAWLAASPLVVDRRDDRFETLLLGGLGRGGAAAAADRTLTRTGAPPSHDAPAVFPAAQAVSEGAGPSSPQRGALRAPWAVAGLVLGLAAAGAIWRWSSRESSVTGSSEVAAAGNGGSGPLVVPERAAVDPHVPAPVKTAVGPQEASERVRGLLAAPRSGEPVGNQPPPPESARVSVSKPPAISAVVGPRDPSRSRLAPRSASGALKPLTGRVRFRVLPASARVSIDGASLQHREGVFELELRPGEHTLSLEVPDGSRLDRRFVVVAGETANLRTITVPP